MTTPAECEACGAPSLTGLVACSYCDTPFPGAPAGVSCPACGDDNLPSRLRCARCNGSLQAVCLFCAQSSSVARSSCAHCGEAFEGAEARKKEREEQRRQQQLLGLAATGISALGAAAASPRGRGILGEVFEDLVESATKKK
ncbi:MAG: hypothetical protein VYE22_34175 [Myxococcota bacterium]|nr:hypothetical protein [Myxococcota bacterium]